MRRQHQPQFVWPLNIETTKKKAQSDGYAVYTLPTEGITDKSKFFDAACQVLPMNPPLQRTCSWDAFSDSVWQGLLDLEAKRIMILWPSANVLAEHARRDFVLALQVFEGIAETLDDHAATLANKKQLILLVEAPRSHSL